MLSAVTAQVGANSGVLNPNLASPEEMSAVPGLDAASIERVLAARPFPDMASFDAILAESLDLESRKAIYAGLFLPIDLNSATTDEIGLVPGVGRRMTHEFEEYRPYRGLAEFHREIGKYVDDEEVARLAQYVFVPMDLNQADREAILSIPGIDAELWTMVESGRPFASLDGFEVALSGQSSAAEARRVLRYLTLAPIKP
jgi:predicted DNA-binding helix-hairpin-helix protein